MSWLVFFCFFCLDSFFYLWRIDFCTLRFDSFVGTISVGSSNLLNPSVTVKVKNQKIFEKKKLLIIFFCWQSFTYSLTLKPLLFLWSKNNTTKRIHIKFVLSKDDKHYNYKKVSVQAKLFSSKLICRITAHALVRLRLSIIIVIPLSPQAFI